MMDLLKQTVTVEELINYAKKYDGNGSYAYQESMYEGYSVIAGFIEERFGIKETVILKTFPYMGR